MADQVEKKDDKPFLGRAVQNGNVRFLSVSAIEKFDPSRYGGCERRWAFQCVFGKKEPQTQASPVCTLRAITWYLPSWILISVAIVLSCLNVRLLPLFLVSLYYTHFRDNVKKQFSFIRLTFMIGA